MSESGTEHGWHRPALGEFELLGTPARAPVTIPEPASAPEPLAAPEPTIGTLTTGPVREEHRLRSLLRALAAPFVAIFALLLKFKTALLVVFKFKLFTVAASMLVSLAAYTTIWGWRFALGFVALLAVHEMGHVLEAKRQGLPVTLPVFMPFVGAAILMRKMPHNAWHEAQVALAGPIVGSLGSAGLLGLGYAYDSSLLKALAFTGFFLNLFNLLPVVPLDGGRAVAALHPALWFIGFGALVVLVLVRPNPILILIVVLAGYDLVQRWHMRHAAREERYYEVARWQRLAVAVVYFGLAALLAVAMTHAHVKRTF